MNKYQTSFKRWKNRNLSSRRLPDDPDQAGRIIDENEQYYDLIQEALVNAEKWDKFTLLRQDGITDTFELLDKIEAIRNWRDEFQASEIEEFGKLMNDLDEILGEK